MHVFRSRRGPQLSDFMGCVWALWVPIFPKEEKLRRGQRELEAQRRERLLDLGSRAFFLDRCARELHWLSDGPSLHDEHARSLTYATSTRSKTTCRVDRLVQQRDEAKHCRQAGASSARVQAAHVRSASRQAGRSAVSCIGSVRNSAKHSSFPMPARRGAFTQLA